MTHVRIRPLLRSTVAALAAIMLVLPSPARAGGGRIVRRGACSGPSDWALDVRQEEGARLRVRLGIEGGRSGQTWHIFLSDDGVGIFSGSRTSESGGHVEVRVRPTDRAGADTISAAANNVVTGEACTARATL